MIGPSYQTGLSTISPAFFTLSSIQRNSTTNINLSPSSPQGYPSTNSILLSSRKASHLINLLSLVIAERRERNEANNRVLFEIPRNLYIYMSVCKCIAQDRGHLMQVLSRRPLCIWNTGCCSEHHFEECQSPFR